MYVMWILTALIAALIIALVATVLYMRQTEAFATKKEKADAIYMWFASNDSPTYQTYRRAMDGASNIVEYEDVARLFAAGRGTLPNVLSTI